MLRLVIWINGPENKWSHHTDQSLEITFRTMRIDIILIFWKYLKNSREWINIFDSKRGKNFKTKLLYRKWTIKFISKLDSLVFYGQVKL